MDPHRIHVFHVAYDDAIVITIPHDLVFDLLPLLEVFLNQDLFDPTVSKSSKRNLPERSLIECSSGSLTPQSVGYPDHDREAYFAGRLKGRFQINCRPTFWN